MRPVKSSQTGMTLIELMIAMTLGLLVVVATTALVVSLMRSNNESIRSMRLSQEMRALADMTTMEIRRARSLTDPLANIGQGALAFQQCNAITPQLNGQCITFAYACNPADSSGQYRMIRRTAANNLEMAMGNAPLACDATTVTQLNSGDLAVEGTNAQGTAVPTFTQLPNGAIQMTLNGRLRSDTSMRRSMTRVIWPRSAPVVP